jgi:uncharacterized damage-inducible protein DinB
MAVKAKSRKKVSEASLIAEQLRRAFNGNAWHGPSVLELLNGVDAGTAAAKPIPDAHSIWELLLHIAVWDGAAMVRLGGKTYQPEGDDNFPPVRDVSEGPWQEAISEAKRVHDKLVRTVAALPDARLRDRVPGKRYNFYFMLQGIAQHELYHAGQIAVLKKGARF